MFIGRLLLAIRSFVAVPARFARMRVWKFRLYTFIGSWTWRFALAWIGLKLRDKWQTDAFFRSWFHIIDWLIAPLLVAALGGGSTGTSPRGRGPADRAVHFQASALALSFAARNEWLRPLRCGESSRRT